MGFARSTGALLSNKALRRGKKILQRRMVWTNQTGAHMRLIRLSDVTEATGLARSTIYKYISAGSFPKPVPLGGSRVAWVEQEINAWIAECIKARDMI